MAAYRTFWRRVGHARWFAYSVRYALSGVDRRIYRASRGRMSMAGPPLFDWLLLTTTGRRSGRPRTTPLVYVADADRLVITSENFGMAGRPAAWRLNLEADPRVTAQLGGDLGRFRARRAGEDEVARFWPRLLEQWPALETYRRRSGERHVFVLEPGA
jgi:deazaflavin-dependent oxidoreductase (nitroreductase family)